MARTTKVVCAEVLVASPDLAEVLPKFREMAREAGRDPASIEITLFGLGEDRVKRLAEMGVARVVPMFPPEKAGTVCRSSTGGRVSCGRSTDRPHRDRSVERAIVSRT
jgi:hypothetical protein